MKRAVCTNKGDKSKSIFVRTMLLFGLHSFSEILFLFLLSLILLNIITGNS